MPFVTTLPDNSLAGIYRTQVLADADAASSGGGVTAIQGAILDADIPADATPGESWWVHDAPAVVGVNASVEIQYGTSGKGFRLEFSAGALEAEGNGWTAATEGTAIVFLAGSKVLNLPEPAGSAADFLAALDALSGTYQFTSTYLSGTMATDDLSAIGSTTWQRADGDSGVPTFTGGVDALPERKAVFDAPLPLYTPRQQAAKDARDGLLISFYQFVIDHAAGEPIASVERVQTVLRQAARAVMMAFNNDVTINGVAITLTDAQFVAWATYLRFGPSDTSVITALGEYNPEGLVRIFELAADPAVPTPTGPITWAGLDTSQWTANAQGIIVPNRLTVAQMQPVLGTAPSEYLNIHDYSWLESE